MRISDVLRVKGTQVVTVTPDTRVRHLVWALARRGAAVMSEEVTAIYTAEVHTITPETSLEHVVRMMTEHRVRHAPVVADGRLRRIVSIGDVVKNRIDELETERAALTDYITGSQ